MKKYSYHFEQLDLITLFVSAFDDTFLYRYDARTREAKERIDVRYVVGPKHRVLFDLNDKAKTMTLPVVTIEQTSLVRDKSRVFNKSKQFTRGSLGETGNISRIPTPVPVNLELNVSIIGKFKEDIDQIIQNFITQCNPYLMVYWKVPAAFGMDFIDEIRSEVQWSGNISYDNPKNIGADIKWRILADTTFTIKGWVFPPLETPQEPIYVVRNKFQVANLLDRVYTYDDYPALSGLELQTEYVTVSAFPEFTNAFYSTSGANLPITNGINILEQNQNTFIFYGKRFGYSNTWYLSSNVPDFFGTYEEIVTATKPIISAFRIPASYISTINDNITMVTLPAFSMLSSGDFTFVTANSSAWTDTSSLGITFNNTSTWNLTAGRLYLQPDGLGWYLQPDGTSLYLQPIYDFSNIYVQPSSTSGYVFGDYVFSQPD